MAHAKSAYELAVTIIMPIKNEWVNVDWYSKFIWGC